MDEARIYQADGGWIYEVWFQGRVIVIGFRATLEAASAPRRGYDQGGRVPILNVRHITTYLYKRAVVLGQHRLMFRPRDNWDQRLLIRRFPSLQSRRPRAGCSTCSATA